MAASQTVPAIRRRAPVAAPLEQRPQVQALLEALEGGSPQWPKFQLVGPSGQRIPLPESVFRALEQVAEVLARGDSITIVPIGQQLTTQQAANILNISRQYLVQLLDAGQLDYTKTGKHRRLRIEDVLAFKGQRDRDRHAALRELSRLSQEFGGYDHD